MTLSLEQCKNILGASDTADDLVIEIRDLLYALAEQVFDAQQFHPETLTADISKQTRHDESVGTTNI